MRSSARLHDVLFETMHQGVVYQDRDGRIKGANPAAEKILGVPRAQLFDRMAAELAAGCVRVDGSPFPVEQFPAVVALRTRANGPDVTVGYASPDGGGLRWISLRAVPLFEDGDERPHGVYSMFEDITERRALEARKEQQLVANARFAAIAEAVPGMILSTALNADGVPYMSFASEAILDVIGLPPESFATSLEPAIARTVASDRGRLAASILEAAANGEDWHQEFLYDHPAKGMRWIEGWMHAVEGASGPNWHGFLMDVTERHVAEAALRDEKAKYQALFETMDDAVYVAAGGGTIVDANPAACRMHAMTVEEIRARGRDGLVVHDDLLASWVLGRSDTAATSGELTLLRKDGSTFPGDVRATAVVPHESTWGGFVVVRDISARKVAEADRLRAHAAELAQAEVERIAAELREAQRIAGVGSFSVDVRTGEGFWSEEMYRIMGRDPALGVPNLTEAAQFARAEVHERVMAQTYRLLQTGEPVVTEFELSLPGGERRQVVMRMEATREASGQIIGGRGTYQDVTDQRALEEQLSKSQRLDAVGALAAGVAHDFNNLLGIIVGYAQCALADLPEGSPLSDDLGEVVAAGLRGASLTRRLLTFASRESVQPVVHRPGDVVRDMGKMLGRLISEDISLRVFVESDAGSVFADPGQVEQVVMNLVINARDAMTQGGELSVSVKGAAVAEARAPTGVVPGPFVAICVADTGSGMDAVTRASMFDAFFTTKAPGRGTGLGLSTVQRIVRQAGGFIEVDTAVGAGTRVTVLLPRASGAPLPESEPSAPDVHAGAEGTVLLVEDDAALRSFAERALTRGGYRVLVASGGEEALRIVRGGAAIDVLLTDVVMPGMGGVEVYRAVREVLGAVPVLFVSGYVGDSSARHEMLADPGHFLAKPFAAEDLLAKVGQVLQSAEPSGR